MSPSTYTSCPKDTGSLLGQGPKVTSPYKLAHVVFRTNQFQIMRDWYRIFLGGRIVFDNGELAFIRYDDEHHRIAIAGVPGTADKVPTSCGLLHVAFTFPTLRDLLTAYTQRKAHGIEPAWCINYGPTTSMYYIDPDGNQVETQIDNYDDMKDADMYMRGHSFEENPIGVEFVPEDLMKLLDEGVDAEKLKKRIDQGPKDFRDVPSAIAPMQPSVT